MVSEAARKQPHFFVHCQHYDDDDDVGAIELYPRTTATATYCSHWRLTGSICWTGGDCAAPADCLVYRLLRLWRLLRWRLTGKESFLDGAIKMMKTVQLGGGQ